MSDFSWHIAPICDAFAPSKYPPPVTVNPAHVGYVIQRYQEGRAMGLVVRGFWELETAQELCNLLNANPGHPRVSQFTYKEVYL